MTDDAGPALLSADDRALAFAEKVIELLDRTGKTATYKFAVLLGLIDVCQERFSRHGFAPESVTTFQLAEAVTAIYWRQARSFHGQELRQISTGRSIADHVRAARIAAAEAPLGRFRIERPAAYRALVDQVEGTLINIPLPRLQKFGIDDHYQGEAQTLTTAAEQNLLKLGELRGRLDGAPAARWAEIKGEYVRQRRMGGDDDDPVTRLVGTVSGMSAELGGIRGALASAGSGRELVGTIDRVGAELGALRGALGAVGAGPALVETMTAIGKQLGAIRMALGASSGTAELGRTLAAVGDELGSIRTVLSAGAGDGRPAAVLATVASELGAIRGALGGLGGGGELGEELRQLRTTIVAIARKIVNESMTRDPETWLGPKLDALAAGLQAHAARRIEVAVLREAFGDGAAAAAGSGAAAIAARTAGHVSGYADDDPGHGTSATVPGGAGPLTTEALLAQLRRLQSTLAPAVHAAGEQRAGDSTLTARVTQILTLLEQLEHRLTPRR
jgi:hypothetical protein